MSNRTCWRTSNPLPFPKSGGFQTSGRVQPMQGAANADFSVQILRSIVLQREMLSWSILPQCWGHGHVDAVFPCFQECWPWMFDSQVHPVSWSTLAMFLFALTWLKLHCLPSVGGIDASNHGRNGGQNWIPLSLLQNKTGLWVLVHCENHVYTAVSTQITSLDLLQNPQLCSESGLRSSWRLWSLVWLPWRPGSTLLPNFTSGK